MDPLTIRAVLAAVVSSVGGSLGSEVRAAVSALLLRRPFHRDGTERFSSWYYLFVAA